MLARGERHALLAFMVAAAVYQIWSIRKDVTCRVHRWSWVLAVPTLFFLINLLWISPFGCHTSEQCRYGLTDAQSLVLLPSTTLIFFALGGRTIELMHLGRWIVTMCALLGLAQAILWLILRFNPVPHEVIYHYVNIYFGTRESIAILDQPSHQGSYFRIVWISSYWLLFGVFIAPLIYGRKINLLFVQAIFGIAIIASYTRGIWLGLILGTIMFTALINILSWSAPDREAHRRLRSQWNISLAGLALSGLIVLCLDWTQGSSGLLMSRFYLPSHSTSSTQIEQLSIRDESAIERKAQALKLIEMWKQRPMTGHGYGAYVKDHFSLDDRPFLYEMVPFALLMKLGILGFGLYLAFLAFILIRLLLMATKSATSVALLSGLTGYLIQAHTNPVFFSFTGMLIFSLFIFLWLSIEQRTALTQNSSHAK